MSHYTTFKSKSKWQRLVALVLFAIIVLLLIFNCTACTVQTEGYEPTDEQKTQTVARTLKEAQPTPTDINYSLERYNLIRRAYWVNGQREKANAVVCPIQKPLGYIVLFTDNGAVVGRFCVDGKVSSLNSFLTPDSEYYEIVNSGEGYTKYFNNWLSDVDGSYGENDSGIFFFTPEGQYVEWSGTYIYSDIPFEVADPVLQIGG